MGFDCVNGAGAAGDVGAGNEASPGLITPLSVLTNRYEVCIHQPRHKLRHSN